MTNPPYILEHLDAIGEILNHPNVYSFLHVPVQSGSDAVLSSMRREYNCDDFCSVVDTLREKVPRVNIATGKDYYAECHNNNADLNEKLCFQNTTTQCDVL